MLCEFHFNKIKRERGTAGTGEVYGKAGQVVTDDTGSC